MKISGSGTLSAGKIEDNLHVSGSAKLKGDFECYGFHSSGSLRGEGSLTVHGDVSSSGSFRLGGSLYGDGKAKSSGSMSIGGEISVKGTLVNSGSLRAGGKVEAPEGINISGSARINGDLSSQRLIKISGSSTIHGDVSGSDIVLGREPRMGRNIYKHLSIINGSIFAKNHVDLARTLVEGDVRGRTVIIGKGTEIKGMVYYVENIEVHDKATLANEPIHITERDL
ncbi:MAG: hypothetical protein ACFFCV_03480 [Promethearchaeota archaeon]